MCVCVRVCVCIIFTHVHMCSVVDLAYHVLFLGFFIIIVTVYVNVYK